MPSLEHAGQSITAYYYHVADPNFSMPPEASAQNTSSSLSIEHRMLNDARLTTISSPQGTQRYIRFFELATNIPAEERELLGFPTFFRNGEEDLVVACPQPAQATSFQIVPSEEYCSMSRVKPMDLALLRL
jgi:hypothetical protein